MSQDRPIHTDALQTLGTIIDDKQGRDAIHIAVEPVVASHKIKPGENIGLDKDGKATGAVEKYLGVADPFLKGPIQAGQRFWMLVYPRTITSLRHVWGHPDFPAGTPEPSGKPYSERWMRNWAMKHTSEDYYGDGDKISEDAAYEFAIRAGHELHIGPYEDARDHINDEWWGHWEAITGSRGERGAYFSCGC